MFLCALQPFAKLSLTKRLVCALLHGLDMDRLGRFWADILKSACQPLILPTLYSFCILHVFATDNSLILPGSHLPTSLLSLSLLASLPCLLSSLPPCGKTSK